MKIIAFIGRKKSGKTASICKIIQNLKGKRIFAFKHINEPEFEIDRKGTDTWRIFNAGAELIVASSSSKLAIIARMNNTVDPLQMIKFLESIMGSPDIVLIEGFHRKIGKDKKVYKIILARNLNDLKELYSILSEPIIAIIVNGISKSDAKKIIPNKPIFDITELDKLVNFIEKLPENF